MRSTLLADRVALEIGDVRDELILIHFVDTEDAEIEVRGTRFYVF